MEVPECTSEMLQLLEVKDASHHHLKRIVYGYQDVLTNQQLRMLETETCVQLLLHQPIATTITSGQTTIHVACITMDLRMTQKVLAIHMLLKLMVLGP